MVNLDMWDVFLKAAEDASLRPHVRDHENGMEKRSFEFEVEIYDDENESTKICVPCIDEPDRVVFRIRLLNIPSDMDLECIRNYFTKKSKGQAAVYLVEPENGSIIVQIVPLRGAFGTVEHFQTVFSQIYAAIVQALNGIDGDLGYLISTCGKPNL